MSDIVAVQLIVSVSTLAGLIATALLQRQTKNGVTRVERAVNGKSDLQIELIEKLQHEVEVLKLGRRAGDTELTNGG